MNPSLTQLPLAFGLALVFFTVMTTTVALPWLVLTQ
jgi:hypothetical protein